MNDKNDLSQGDKVVLKELEALIGQSIPYLDKIRGEGKVGVQVERGNVVGLSLLKCNLKKLPQSFGNLHSLKYLVLEKNYLTSLPAAFCNLNSLQELWLATNKLKKLPNCFGDLKSLHTLSLGGNQLTNLPKSFGKLNLLQIVYLSRNQLRTLPQSFGNLESLRVLNLYDSQLINLPESFGQLSSLQELDLRHNQLKTLPESFGQLLSLQDLKLNKNQLEALPESFGQLKSLKKLDLEQNHFKNLPESFGRLQSIQTVNFRFNKLQYLPESFGQLQTLTQLRLDNNKLTGLPESFRNLQNLSKLKLSKNPWEGDWKILENFKDIPQLFTLCRKLYGLNLFISCKMEDIQKYTLMDFKNNLESREIIHKVWICEDWVGGIDDLMDQEVLGSEVVLFIATEDSKASDSCRHELALAQRYGTKILPIQGNNCNWEELKQINLSAEGQNLLDLSTAEWFKFSKEGIPYLCDEIYNYLLKNEEELKKFRNEGAKKKKNGIKILQSKIDRIFISYINSEQYQEEIEKKFKEFGHIFQEISSGKINSHNYFSKWIQIIES